MNKKILYLTLAVVSLILSASTVTAIVTPPQGIKDLTLSKIWAAIMDLQKQITNIQLTPGPTGPTGPIGPTGPAGKDGAQGPDGKDGATVHFGPAEKLHEEYFGVVTMPQSYDNTATTDGILIVNTWKDERLGDNILLRAYTNPNAPQYGVTSEGEWRASVTLPIASGEDYFVEARNVNGWTVWWRPLTA